MSKASGAICTRLSDDLTITGVTAQHAAQLGTLVVIHLGDTAGSRTFSAIANPSSCGNVPPRVP